MAETKEALRVEVLGVCRTYCAQVWDEALNQAGVEASSVLRRQKVSTTPQPFVPPLQAAPRQTPLLRWQILRKAALARFPPPSSPPKVAKQPRANGKVTEVSKGVASDATKPPTIPQDPNKDKEAPRMELVLATLSLPAKGDPKGTGQESLKATVPQS